ncbi:MAG: pyruvate dehydrogenase complex dihydrolipoamide acetyltransferase [Methylovirgula sp.]
MPINILMPALSPTMEKGNLAKWLKKEGDRIKSGDVIAEIETDKATMEVEAVDEGVLAKILVPAGTADVPVNDVIAVIAGEGEDAKSIQGPAKSAPAAAAPAKSAAAAPAPAPAPTAPAPSPASAAPPPRPAPVLNLVSSQPAPSGQRVFTSPLARRIAKDGGIDLAAIAGSGPHGRIVERDVTAAIAAGPVAAPRPAPVGLPASMSDAVIKGYFSPDEYDEVPHDNMRRTIARRLSEANQTIPQFFLTLDCEIDALLKLREDINKAAPKAKDGTPAYKVSVNDMVIKALAMALVTVPGANVSFMENAMLHHHHADVAVAVAIPDGLITPIVRQADLLSLSAISNKMKDFATRAKDRKLKPEEYQGAMSAISNLGMFGIKDFCAVINPPQSSILAIGMGEERAIVRKGQIVVANIMSVTITCDHRAMDGAKGAELIAAFKRFIENPVAMLV